MLNIAELKTLNANIAKLYESAFAKARSYGGVINGKDAKAIEKAERKHRKPLPRSTVKPRRPPISSGCLRIPPCCLPFRLAACRWCL